MLKTAYEETCGMHYCVENGFTVADWYVKQFYIRTIHGQRCQLVVEEEDHERAK